jgi:hypothetical protein
MTQIADEVVNHSVSALGRNSWRTASAIESHGGLPILTTRQQISAGRQYKLRLCRLQVNSIGLPFHGDAGNLRNYGWRLREQPRTSIFTESEYQLLFHLW